MQRLCLSPAEIGDLGSSEPLLYTVRIFFSNAIAGHPSESSEEPLSKHVQGVRGDEIILVVDPPIANKGNEPEEVFDSCEIERRRAFFQGLCSCAAKNIDCALFVGAFLDKSYTFAQR